MFGLDTNILVRFLVRDDEAQHAAVVAALERDTKAGVTFFVSDLVLAEVIWVLTSRYRCSREEVAGVVRQLDESEELVVESTERVVRALRAYQHGKGGFADHLIGARVGRACGCEEPKLCMQYAPHHHLPP